MRIIFSITIWLLVLSCTARFVPPPHAPQYNNHEVNGKRVVIILDLELLGYTEDRIVLEQEIKCVQTRAHTFLSLYSD